MLYVHWGHQWDVWLSGGRVCSESQHPCTTQDGCGPKSGCVWTIPSIIRPRIFIIRILEIYMKYILPFSVKKFSMDLHYFFWLLHSQTLTIDHKACLDMIKFIYQIPAWQFIWTKHKKIISIKLIKTKLKITFNLHYLSLIIQSVRIHSQTFHECPSHLHMVVLNIEQFFNQVGKSAYFTVFCPVTLGLAWVSPELDLPQPSLRIARDMKPSLPLEHNNNWEI